MIATKEPSLEMLRLGEIREILKTPGPCITITLPPYRPGEPAGSMSAILKSSLQEISKRLAAHQVSKTSATDLLAPLERLMNDPAMEGGAHWGRVVFCAPSVLKQFELTLPPKASVSVGSMFAIRDIAGEFARPSAFYLLTLSRSGVHLSRCAGLHCESVKLPHGVPETLEEAMALEPPDHDLENRSAANGSAGGRRAVRFGTAHEKQRLHIADYYKLVDRAVRSLLQEGEIALILSGVEEDCAAFRAVTTCRHLVHRTIANQDGVRDGEKLLLSAYAVLASEESERQAAALRSAIERVTPSRFVSDPKAILEAAFDGRIKELYANEDAKIMDEWDTDGYRPWKDEDLINAAMAQTILCHGQAAALPAGMMPAGLEVAAILHY
jgi:hypothetical protein